MKKFDAIIVGAGTSGTTAARFLGKYGFKVCLLDAKPREKIGDKICGDAVGTEIFDFLKIPHPKGDEIVNKIKGVLLYSPDLSGRINIKDPKQAGYIIDRLKFGQRLLNEALDSGVKDFYDSTHVLRPIFDGERVVGVIVKGKSFEGEEELYANAVIDASGFHSALKKYINFPYLEKEVPFSDAIVAYREIIDFKNDDVVENADYITIILDQKRAPGGYIWYFPRSNKSVNMGVGVDQNNKRKLKEYYKREVFNKYVSELPHEKLSSGGGIVPVCKPLWTVVADGIMFAGDSACQVNPLHGGGIDPSMRAGFYAAKAFKHATERGNFFATDLWSYNELTQKNIGASFAALDLLRITLQGLSNEDLNFGLKQGLLSGEEILEIASKGELTLDLFGMVGKAIKGFLRPDLLLDLNYLRTRMGRIKQLYDQYPDNPSDLGDWVEKVNAYYMDIRIRLGKKELF
ncbi:MAG: geranylgeranyl reductase family protein [Promethearchaeota archaeon]